MLPAEDRITAETESNEITRLLRSATSESIGDFYDGKRRHLRFRSAHPFEADVACEDVAGVVPVSLQDISASGAACWSKHKVSEDVPLRLREFTSDDSGVWISARVTHCTPGIRGYLIGAAFDHPADDDVLAQLAAECAAQQTEPMAPAPSWWQRLLAALHLRRVRAPADDGNLRPAATTAR